MSRYRPTHSAPTRSARGSTWTSILATLLIAVGLVLSALALDHREGPGVVPVDLSRAGTATPPTGVVEGKHLTPAGERTPGAHPARGVPTSLTLPTLDVVAEVVDVAMTPDRVLWPPDDPSQLGWWAAGATPGSRLGSALIFGHSVSTGGGAFDDLDTLEEGDPVRVRTSRGVLHYAVTSVEIHRKDSLARDVQRLFSQSVPGRLVLVTCEDWDGEAWLSNAVVIAAPTRYRSPGDAPAA